MGCSARLLCALGVVGLLVAPTMLGCAPRTPHETGGVLRFVPFVPPAAGQRACISGRVTDALTGEVLPGATLEAEPDYAGVRVSTNRDGFYYAEFKGGTYHLRFVKPEYRSAERTVELVPGETAGWDVSLEPTAPVIVHAGGDVTGAPPSSTVAVTATVVIRDDSRLREIRWAVREPEGGVAVRVTGGDGPTVRVTLPEAPAFKRSLLYHLRKEGRLLDRWMVVGLTPSDLRDAGRVTLTARAATTSGTYTDTVDIIADLRAIAGVNPGLHNIPLGEVVLLHGKTQPSYAWSLEAPVGSAARLREASTQNPSFTPDIAGTYTLSEGNTARLRIHAGSWNGMVVARETRLRPRWIGVDGCLCHFDDSITPKFIAWRESGHAEIFEQCINTVFRYEEQCFVCHTVGFGGKGDVGGITATSQYATFREDPAFWDRRKTPPIVTPRPGNYDDLLFDYSNVARHLNVQCENCHGPNNSPAHKTLTEDGAPERISLSAEVCGVCHDESAEPSHRQWYANDHANYNLAIDVATVDRRGGRAGDCGRCHAAQGFLTWIGRQERAAPLAPPDGETSREELAALGLTEAQVHPVTCPVCHESHNPGNTFRWETAKVPVRRASFVRTPPGEPGGETAGRGALCITCHSTEGGLHGGRARSRFASVAAPHAPQGDLLLGRNAFFSGNTTSRSHSKIEDTCVWCHVKPVPKSSEGGYPRGGASHTFQADIALCARCHQEFAGDELLVAMERDMEKLKRVIETALADEIRRKGGARLVAGEHGGPEVFLPGSHVRDLELFELQGEMAVAATTTSGRRFTVRLDRLNPGDVPLLASDFGELIGKAAWNYFLLRNDGSRGAHNPQYVATILSASLTRIAELRR